MTKFPKKTYLVSSLAVMALGVGMLLLLSNSATAQEAETPKTCEFKEANLLFQSRLIRTKGVLTGYEVTMKNTGAKALLGMNVPLLDHEMAHASIFENASELTKRHIVSVDIKAYLVDGPPEMAQKRYKGDLRAGETKKYLVKLEDVLKVGYSMKVDSTYDLLIGIDVGFYPPDKSFKDAAAIYSPISSKIAFGGCLSYKDVKLNEVSGK
jgi:hypothetical protein